MAYICMENAELDQIDHTVVHETTDQQISTLTPHMSG